MKIKHLLFTAFLSPLFCFSQTPVTKTLISTSSNIYSTLVVEQTCLHVNPDLNTLIFTHRANPSGGLSTSSGHIVVSRSLNGGATWQPMVITSGTNENRYPSGVIYNPTGNTNPANAYAVAVGPTAVGSAWTQNYFASGRLDSTLFNSTYENSTNGYLVRNGLQTYGTRFHVACSEVLNETYINTHIYNGIWNPTLNKVDWSKVTFYHPFRKVGNTTYNYLTHMAWAPDGSVGYIYFIGIDSIYNTMMYPVVYKSLNNGQTWTQLPFFNFATLPSLTSYIWPPTTGAIKPYFLTSSDAVVDSAGQLHITGLIVGAYSNHPDSAIYMYSGEPGKIFNIYTTPTGGWGAMLIDSLKTKPYQDIYLANIIIDCRIQSTRNAQGTKIFSVWADTDPLYSTENEFPDIIGCGWNITANNTLTPVKNFTKNTTFDGSNYFHFVSPVILESGTTYKIPVTTTDPGQTDLLPATHKYVSGIEFTAADFIPYSISPMGSVTMCNGETVVLSTNHIPGNTYQWKKDGVNITGATGSSYNATQSGTYVLVTNNTNTSNAVVVTVNPAPLTVVTPAGPIYLCPWDSVTLQCYTDTSLSYQWMNNNSIIPGATNPDIIVKTNGSYTVKVTNSFLCEAMSNPVIVAVLDGPVQPVINGPDTAPHSLSHTYSIIPQTGAAYLWNVNNGTITGGANTHLVTVIWDNTIQGSIMVDVIKSGCHLYDTMEVVIGNPGITEYGQDKIHIFPNPVSGLLFLNGKEEIGVVTLSTLDGRIVYRGRYNGSIDCSGLPAGVYILTMEEVNAECSGVELKVNVIKF